MLLLVVRPVVINSGPESREHISVLGLPEVNEIMVRQRIRIFRPITAAPSFELKIGPDPTGPATQLPFGSGSRGHVEDSSL